MIAPTSSGATALPSREAAWTSPWPVPRSWAGSHRDIAVVAVGNAALSPAPSARRDATRVPSPPAAPVAAVAAAQTPPSHARVRRAPKRSPSHPPGIWRNAYGSAKAENTSPIWASDRFRSVWMNGAAVEMLLRSM